MKAKINLRMEIILLLIAILPLTALLILGNKIPDQVPMHWNIKGEIDNYGSKWIVAFLNIGLHLFLFGLLFIDPKKDSYNKFSSIIYKIRLGLNLFFIMISYITYSTAAGYPIDIGKCILIGLPLLFCFLGNVMVNLKPNWFIGIRTPWTLENEEVWRRTHRLGSYLWFWGGLLLSLLGIFLPQPVSIIVFIVILSLMVLIPVVYSYKIYPKSR